MFQNLNDYSLSNKISPDETIIFHKNVNNELNFDLSSHSIDLDHKKNEEEDDFNKDYNLSFLKIFEDKTTDFETRKKDSFTSLRFNNANNLDTQNIIIYSFEDISKILKENSLNNILDQFTKDEIIENYENNMKLLNKKRKRNRTKNKENENEIIYKRGRKKMNDDTDRKHDKYAPNNIIKKIKLKLIEKSISFINAIVNKNNEKSKREIFKKLDYKYIKKMKQDLFI